MNPNIPILGTKRSLSTIYLDMDGVPCDFTKHAMALHGMSLPPMDITWNFFEQAGLTLEQFWAPIHYDFWSTVPWTLEGKLLVSNLLDIVGNDPDKLVFVSRSGPKPSSGALEGKRDWLAREIGADFADRLVLADRKQALASDTKLLIDDNTENCDRFCKKGGHAILVPRPWNIAKPLCLADGSFDVLRFNALMHEKLKGNI